MKEGECVSNISDYESKLQQVQDALEHKMMEKAFNAISNLMKQNMSFAEPHNLLGIYYEIVGEDDKARKHYRAAYALDPTYKPACHNLNRVVTWYCGKAPKNFDYGLPLLIKKKSQKGDI